MAGRRFLVSCTHCKRTVVIVSRVTGAELDRLQAHLLACRPSEVIGPYPGVEATLRHFRVASTDPDDQPPPAA